MTALAALELISLAIVVWHTICACNHMGRDTRLSIALAVVLVFASSLTRAVLLIADDARPTLASCGFAIGVAIGMLANRRRDVRCPCLPSFPVRRNDDKEHPA